MVIFVGFSALFILFLSARMNSETARTFLSKYGWTIKEKLAEHEVALPKSFEHRPGDFPAGIYWAYNNEFSKEIGLDLKPYLGNPVNVSLYTLEEALPAFVRSLSIARAVIVTRDQIVIGAWIDKGRPYAFACSLNRRSFDDITQKRWGDWLVSAGVVNPENELEKKLARMSPEEVITFFYNAIDRQEYSLAYATFSREMAINYLFSNLGQTELFNGAYSGEYADKILANIRSAKLKNIRFYLEPAEYEVVIDMKFKERRRSIKGDGTYTWFIQVTKEIDKLGWRIISIGTGP